MKILEWIHRRLQDKKLLFALLDPDRKDEQGLVEIALRAQDAGVDALLIGSSVLIHSRPDEVMKRLKDLVNLPLIIFPGDVTQLSPQADAVLLLSLLSGRNPQYLIGEHVKAAPILKRYQLEAIPTAYLLVDSGEMTSVQFVSGTMPLPADKPDLAGVHALAGEYLGMQLVYLEAGSGSRKAVPTEIISHVRESIRLPLIVGGGIRDADTVKNMFRAGADILVVGNILESPAGLKQLEGMTSFTRER